VVNAFDFLGGWPTVWFASAPKILRVLRPCVFCKGGYGDAGSSKGLVVRFENNDSYQGTPFRRAAMDRGAFPL
jgi:hypothetical protein